MSEPADQATSKTENPVGKSCRACGKEIAATAYICPECNEYQKPWRNELKYWAGIASLIVLMSSGIAFSSGLLKQANDYVRPNALVVSELDTFGNASFVNMSGQNVWIRDLRVKSSNPTHDLRWDVNQVLAPQKLHTIRLVELSQVQFRGTSRALFGSPQGDYAIGLSESQIADIAGDIDTAQAKYVTSYLLAGGPEHQQVDEFLRGKTATFPCNATVTYMYLESQRLRVVPIPCIGVVKQRDNATAAKRSSSKPRQ
jgi:hypothetical protein